MRVHPLLYLPVFLVVACVSRLDKLHPGKKPSPVVSSSPATSSGPDAQGAVDGASGDAADGEAGPVVDATDPLPGDASTSDKNCGNMQQDDNETATDCGGGACRPCGLRLNCELDRDCASGVCDADEHVCLGASCRNGAKDPGEGGIDCGGDCVLCFDGASCGANSHCRSGVCNSEGFCETPTCEDDVLNGQETAKDCGGGDCDPCPEGAPCLADRDCDTAFCKDTICADAQCGDDETNGSETDLGCGGTCPPCAADLLCLENSDCLSAICEAAGDTLRCTQASCDDDKQNQGESGPDCGGPCGRGCQAGTPCTQPTDCADGVCTQEEGETARTCKAAACPDGTKNGTETDIDCGGECPQRCVETNTCAVHEDCETNSCAQTCQPVACDDGRLNGKETAVDCGGSDGCEACPVAEGCLVAADCLSERCDETCEPGGPGAPCTKNADCATDLCAADTHTCSLGHPGDSCAIDSDCGSESCANETCEQVYTGATCESDADCYSSHCTTSCQLGALGAECEQPSDCLSGACAVDDSCAASAYSVKNDSDNTGEGRLSLHVRVKAPAPIAWNNVAFLYFFTAEATGTFKSYSYNGPGSVSPLALEVASKSWVLVWKSTSASAVPTASEAIIDFQLGMASGSATSPFVHSNDYSYLAGSGNTNPKIVVCQRDGDRFKQVAGVAPTSIDAPDPCALIVSDCEDSTTLSCHVPPPG